MNMMNAFDSLSRPFNTAEERINEYEAISIKITQLKQKEKKIGGGKNRAFVSFETISNYLTYVL